MCEAKIQVEPPCGASRKQVMLANMIGSGIYSPYLTYIVFILSYQFLGEGCVKGTGVVLLALSATNYLLFEHLKLN